MRDLVRNNKGPAALISVALVALLAWLAFGFFGIHTAFIDDVVDEDGPVFDVAASSSAEPAVAETAPLEVPPAESAAAEEPVANASAAEAPAAEPAAEEPVSAEEPPAEEPATEEPANTEAPAAEQPVSAEAPAAEEPVAEAPPSPDPTATPVPTPVPEPTPEPQQATPGEVVTLFRGSFSGLNDYAVAGNVSVLNNGTEQRFLRFENFASDNGPDLRVYLRAASGEFISLGNLSGNIGNQNYEIPVGVDLNVFSTVEIWCERFSSGFGAAALGAA